MTPIQCLRIWRPSIRATRAPVPRLALRRQQCAFSGSRKLQYAKLNGEAETGGKEAAQQKDSRNDDTDFKKLRMRELEDPNTKELYSESHPRLKSHEGRMSIPQFKKRWQPQKTPDTSKLVTLYGMPDCFASPALSWLLEGPILKGSNADSSGAYQKAVYNPSASMAISSSSSPSSTKLKPSRA